MSFGKQTGPNPSHKASEVSVDSRLTVGNVALVSVSQDFLRDLFLHQKKAVSEGKLAEYTETMVSGRAGPRDGGAGPACVGRRHLRTESLRKFWKMLAEVQPLWPVTWGV